MKKIVCESILIFLVITSYGQNDSTSAQGKIMTGDILIQKTKEIILPKANKLYQKATPIPFETRLPKIDFNIIEPNFDWPMYQSNLTFDSVSYEYPLSKYPNYVKLGYGNFGAPLLELGIFEKFLGGDTKGKIFYESFKNGPLFGSNSGSAIGMIDLSVAYQKNNFTLTPFLSFRRKQYRFYGNTDRVNSGFNPHISPQISWDNFGFGITLNGATEKLKYELKPEITNSNQNLKKSDGLSKERTIGANGELSYKIDTSFTTGFNIEGHFGRYEGGLKYERSLFLLKPWVTYTNGNIFLKSIFNIVSGKSDDVTQSGFYPELIGEWTFTKDWLAYGKFASGVAWVGLNELLFQNEFSDDSLTILNLKTLFEFESGIKGSPVKNMIINTSLSISKLDNLPIFIPSSTDSSRYTVTYDKGTVDKVQFNVKWIYNPINTSTYGATLELNRYSTEMLDRPWNLPTFVFQAYTSQNISKNFIISGYILSMGGIKSSVNVDLGFVNLNPFLDIGVGVKYWIKNRISIFMDLNNLLNNEYERYIGYPVRGLNFRLGGKYHF